MNILNNMEAIFSGAAALTLAIGIAGAVAPAHVTAPAALQMSATDSAHMQVVSVTGKRLSAAEKARFI